MTSTALLESLRQIVGTTHVLTDGDLTAYEQDWRKRVHGKSLAVVRPFRWPAGPEPHRQPRRAVKCQ